MWIQPGKALRRVSKREDGSSMIELAIVLPVLLLLFVGAAELGRLFYTYTTLAKATKVGARYLSTSKLASSSVAADRTAATVAAQNLVVCGYASSCTGQTPIVRGLSSANVSVTLPVAGATVKYVSVQIQNYPYTFGAFNLELRTGLPNGTIYGTAQNPGSLMTPGITMRYMP
jgi:Flp pilus assembly protein TadG